MPRPSQILFASSFTSGAKATLRSKLGTAPDTLDCTSSVADEMLVKMLLADSALRQRYLLKADVPNAYPQGLRGQRPNFVSQVHVLACTCIGLAWTQ